MARIHPQHAHACQHLVLGSNSSRLSAIADYAFGCDWTRSSPDIDVMSIHDADPSALALARSQAKADALKVKFEGAHDLGAVIIATDVVMSSNGAVRANTSGVEESMHVMRSVHHAPPSTHAALVVVNMSNGLRAAGVDVSTVYFTPIPEDVIKRIALACESAGGNGRVEKEIGVYIHHFDGASDTLMGLPLALLRALLVQVKAPADWVIGEGPPVEWLPY